MLLTNLQRVRITTEAMIEIEKRTYDHTTSSLNRVQAIATY